MNAANGGARVLIGSRGDRAGIQDDDFGRAGIARAFQAAIGQLPLDGRAVSLRRAAAEVLHMIGRHKLIILSVGALRAVSKRVYDHNQRMAKSDDR